MEWGRDSQGEVDFNKPIQYGPTDVGFDEFFGVAASLDISPIRFIATHDPVQPVTETQERLPFPRFVREGPKAKDFDPEEVLDRLNGRGGLIY